MKLQTNRSGFALPMAILVIGFITAGVLAGFARTGAEVEIAENQSAEAAAFAVAEAGLETYLGNGRVDNPDQLLTFPDPRPNVVSRARVTATLMQAGATTTDPSIWLIRSVGEIAIPGQPVATRTVAQLAVRVVGTMQVLSSWTSLSGLIKNGAAGDISGYDACTGNAVAGVATPTGMLTGKDEAITGVPQHREMGTPQEMADSVMIDWPNIAKPVAPAITPDHVVCLPGTDAYDANYTNCGSWPPASDFTDPNYWPVIVINGSSPLPSNGRGVLIVTGDLTFGGGDEWSGIILVGGKITDNGSGNIEGAVVNGLNILKGMTVGQSSKANGTKDYTYNSCSVANAASGMSRLKPMTNTWADNLSTW